VRALLCARNPEVVQRAHDMFPHLIHRFDIGWVTFFYRVARALLEPTGSPT
jgi:hypothetical protein